jgi:hypothetical protein
MENLIVRGGNIFSVRMIRCPDGWSMLRFFNTTATLMGITQYYKQKEYPSLDVIPAKAGIQCFVWFPASAGTSLDSRFHGNDKKSRCRVKKIE